MRSAWEESREEEEEDVWAGCAPRAPRQSPREQRQRHAQRQRQRHRQSQSHGRRKERSGEDTCSASGDQGRRGRSPSRKMKSSLSKRLICSTRTSPAGSEHMYSPRSLYPFACAAQERVRQRPVSSPGEESFVCLFGVCVCCVLLSRAIALAFSLCRPVAFELSLHLAVWNPEESARAHMVRRGARLDAAAVVPALVERRHHQVVKPVTPAEQTALSCRASNRPANRRSWIHSFPIAMLVSFLVDTELVLQMWRWLMNVVPAEMLTHVLNFLRLSSDGPKPSTTRMCIAYASNTEFEQFPCTHFTGSERKREIFHCQLLVARFPKLNSTPYSSMQADPEPQGVTRCPVCS